MEASVAAFLRKIASLRTESLSINPLSPELAEEATAALHADRLLAAELGAIVLDDAGDSNPYCFVTKGALAGMVVHFSHDADLTVAFPSLAAFEEALRRAVEEGVSIDDLPHAPTEPLGDQPLLVARLLAWASGDGGPRTRDELGTAEAGVISHLPLLDPADVDTLRILAESPNFLLREAVACFILARPLPAHASLAQLLAVDRYDQVRRPARNALDALRAQ